MCQNRDLAWMLDTVKWFSNVENKQKIDLGSDNYDVIGICSS